MKLRRVALCGVAALTFFVVAPRPRIRPAAPLVDKAAAISRLRAMPLAFEENRGQTAAEVSFVARGHGYALWTTAGGPLLQVGGGRNQPPAATLRLRPVNAVLPPPEAESPLAGRASYFIGNDATRWITGVPRFAALRYPRVYDGIDLVLHGTQDAFEYDFVVDSHADPAQIAVAFDGAERLRLEPDGDLSLLRGDAALRFHRPIAYQEDGNGRQLVDARYQVGEGNEVRFVLGEYDRTRPLVIDPVIDYSTYLSGANRWSGVAPVAPSSDDAYGLAVDAAGSAYLTGFTNAIDFPMAGAPFDTTCAGCFSSGGDAFVAKIDPSQSGANSLVFTTYLGAMGPGSSGGNAVAVDASGAVHVTGWTNGYDNVSTPANDAFPVTASALQPNDGGDLAVLDAFLTKLDATGSTLLYSTYLGSNNVDEGYGVHVDAAGFTYVAGRTAGANFAPLKNGFQMTHGSPGLSDAFVVKIDTQASGPASLVYGSFYGGTGSDHVESLAIDAMGRAYVAGDSNSVGNTLPMVNGFLPVTTPGQHAFMAMFDPALNGAPSLVYSTYIGTSGTQGATFREGGIAVDANGMVFMTGGHFGGTFDTTPGAYRSAVQGSEAFIVKIDPSLSGPASLVAATLLGGSFNDAPGALTLDGGGNPIVTGWTTSSDFPITACGFPKKSGQDAFVTALNKNLDGLLFSSILGGFGSDFGYAVAVGPTAIYVAGGSDSLDYPTTANAFDPTHNGTSNGSGARDAFLTVISNPYDRCPNPPSAAGSNQSTPEDTPKTITLAATDAGGHSAPPDQLTWTITQLPTKGTLDTVSGVMTHGFGSAYTAAVIYTPNPNYFGPDSFKFQVNDGSADSNIATVSINVSSVNDSPTANPQNVTTLEGSPASIALTGSDPENQPLTYAISHLPLNGVLAGSGNLFTYTPNAGFSGADSFTFTVKDSLNAISAPAVVSIDVTPLNHPPAAVPDTAATDDATAIVIAVLANDVDQDGDLLALGPVLTCAQGTLAANPDSTVLYTPNPGFVGTDTCEYTAIDPSGAASSASITIDVSQSNRAPVVTSPGDQSTAEGQPVSLAIVATDLDNDPLTFEAAGLPPGLSIDAAGTITGSPAAGSAGSYVVTVTVDDGHGASASAGFAWVVTPPVVVNLPPVCIAAAPSVVSIWPPSLQLIAVDVLGVVDPEGGVPAIRITGIQQDEPTKTMGNPNTWIDGFGINTATALVRAERGGTPAMPSDGRVYEIHFEATDAEGASCAGVVMVGVPKDPDLGPAIDSGVRYDSTIAGGLAKTKK